MILPRSEYSHEGSQLVRRPGKKCPSVKVGLKLEPSSVGDHEPVNDFGMLAGKFQHDPATHRNSDQVRRLDVLGSEKLPQHLRLLLDGIRDVGLLGCLLYTSPSPR